VCVCVCVCARARTHTHTHTHTHWNMFKKFICTYSYNFISSSIV